MERRPIRDVPGERLLRRDRDPLRVEIEVALVDPARPAPSSTPTEPGRTSLSRASPSAASDPIVDTPAAASRSSARGPTPGSTRTGSGARKRASAPGGTTVMPPGLRRSAAILQTTFDVDTPSEHVSDVAARTET
jgi:hypothetical protein